MGFVSKAVGSFVGGITGAKQAANAASQAAGVQSEAAQKGIDEQKRQFDKMVELFSPFVKSGTQSLTMQGDIAGLSGAEAQQKALLGIETSPIYKSMVQQGEDAILQNASATGGLRGGNIQASLSQFRPQLLDQLVERQYGRLSGLTQLGQASAGMQAGYSQNYANNVANLYANQGAAQAGGIIAKGNQQRQAFSDLLDIAKASASFINPAAGAF